MLRGSVLTALALLSSPAIGQSASRPLTAAEKTAIKRGFDAELRDPASAQFRLGPDQPKAQAGWKSEKYCGLVNAKNAYGGYTGFKVFTIFVKRDANGRIISASFPDVQTGDGFLGARLVQANIRLCKETGYSIDL